MTIKLNDTQLVIITRALNNGNVIGAYDHNAFSCTPRAYTMAVNGMIKNGIVETISGLKGSARDGDYAVDDDRRLFLTAAFLKHYLGDEAAAPATKKAEKAPKAPKATKAAAKAVEPVVTDEEADEDVLDEEEVASGSIVAPSYREGYAKLREVGGSGQGCNDGVDQFLRSRFMSKVNGKGRERLDIVALVEFAIDNNVWSDAWDRLNNGQKRMNIANAMRRAIANGARLEKGGLKAPKVAKAA